MDILRNRQTGEECQIRTVMNKTSFSIGNPNGILFHGEVRIRYFKNDEKNTQVPDSIHVREFSKNSDYGKVAGDRNTGRSATQFRC